MILDLDAFTRAVADECDDVTAHLRPRGAHRRAPPGHLATPGASTAAEDAERAKGVAVSDNSDFLRAIRELRAQEPLHVLRTR